jgi:hypothetical protein
MTSLTVTPAPVLRPVPWLGLGWVAWRRYRTVLVAALGVLALFAIFLIIDGERIRSGFTTYRSCIPVNSAVCQFAWENFRSSAGNVGLNGALLLFLPGLIGVFAGAPTLARDLETGTFRYAWTQGVGRTRWAVAVLAPGAVGVAAIMGAFGALVAWHNQPLAATGITPRLHATAFPVTGLAVAGWALLGFALGVAAGLFWRRVVPAMATAFAAWFGLAFLAAEVLRPNYLAPLRTTSRQVADQDLTLGQWWTRNGHRVSTSQINNVLSGVGIPTDGGKSHAQPGGVPANTDPVQYLLQHGYQQVTRYQPDRRYWTFQWIEFGWLLTLSVLLLVGTIWLLRRRPA